MTKMTKNVMKELLKEENYMDALALVANKVMKFKTFEGQDAERERIYNKLMNWAYEFNNEADEDDYNDYEENVLRIDTAIWCAIDE